MDKDRIDGIGHQLKGAVKEGLGVVLGDAKLRAEGIAERASGKVQNAVGSAKDVVRDAARDVVRDASAGVDAAAGEAEGHDNERT